MTTTVLSTTEKEIASVLRRARTPWPTPKLYDIQLPPGIVPGFSIDFAGDQLHRYQSSTWLSQGFDGVRFIGAGIGQTVIADSPGYQDSSVFIGAHDGVVAFESLTIQTSERKAIHAGFEKAPAYSKFQVRLRDVHIQAKPTTPDGIRSVWGLFTWNCDTDLEDVSFDGANLNEHTSYAHGYALRGSRWVRVKVEGSGAENDKHATRPFEVRFTPGATIYRADCTYQNWNQPWSWRGGAGIVVQGSGADVVVERCLFLGGKDNSHCRCVMIDDGGMDHYGMDGVAGHFPANGWVILKDCGVSGSGTVGTASPIVRVGSIMGASQATARGFLMDGCGGYGKLVLTQLGNLPAGKAIIRRSNTAAIKELCRSVGMDITSEVCIPTHDRLIPLSEGFTA